MAKIWTVGRWRCRASANPRTRFPFSRALLRHTRKRAMATPLRPALFRCPRSILSGERQLLPRVARSRARSSGPTIQFAFNRPGILDAVAPCCIWGDPRRAVTLAETAYEFGHRSGSIEIEALGLMYRGFYRLNLGDTRAGLDDQDHAAALALSGKVDPITSGVLYCNILWACRTFGDWSRANQWTLGYQRFCTASRMGVSGSCQLHRAEVLGVQGSLHEALAHINDALVHLSDDSPWALGDAYRVLGDIHAAIGDADAALAAYEKAYSLGWSPEPGNAMLLLERGEPEAAYVSLERSLIGQSWWTLQRQGMLLAHLALVAVHAGRHDKAEGLIDDLAGQADRWPMPSIRALTNEASALIALQRGNENEALRRLHLARQLWTSINSRINAARLRLQIASLQLDLGDRIGATSETRAAYAAAEELDSDKLRRDCRAFRVPLSRTGAGKASNAGLPEQRVLPISGAHPRRISGPYFSARSRCSTGDDFTGAE